LERGDSVCVLRRGKHPTSALVLEGSEQLCAVFDGDLLGAGVLDAAIGEQGIDTVFHLAAQPIVAEALRAPSRSFDVNVRGTWLLLESCLRHGVAPPSLPRRFRPTVSRRDCRSTSSCRSTRVSPMR